jgi:transcriptional regulator with XRE-family HTH domain
MSEDPADSNLLGAFISAQQQMASLSLRELSAMTDVSNPYLSQIERGLSEPSAGVLTSIAKAPNLSAEALFTGRLDHRVDTNERQCNRNRASNGPPAHRAAEAGAARRIPELSRGERS